MAKQKHQIIITRTIRGASVLAQTEVPSSGTIEKVRVRSDATPSGPFKLDIKIDGTSIYTPISPTDNRPVLSIGHLIDENDTLNVAVTEGQKLSLIVVSGNGAGQSLYVTITIEDGEAVQGDPGDDGIDGTVIRNGSGAPSNALGVDGDYYIRNSNGDYYQKVSGAYTIIGNIKGPQGDRGDDGAGVPTGGTTGQLLAKASNADGDVEFIDPPTGGGGSFAGDLFSQDAKCYAPLPQCDFFGDEAQTLAKWTDVEPSSFSKTVTAGHLSMTVLPTTGSGTMTGIFQSLPAGDCTIIIKAMTDAINANYTGIGIALFQDIVTNPTTSDILTLIWSRSSAVTAELQQYNDVHNFGALVGSQASLPTEFGYSPCYLKMIRKGTVWSCFYSRDGKIWTDQGATASEGSYFTPAQFGLIMANVVHNNTNTFDVEFVYYWDGPDGVLPGGLVGSLPPSVIDTSITCLGDSLTQGYGQPLFYSWPNQLAKSLDYVSIHANGQIIIQDDGVRTGRVLNKGVNSFVAEDVRVRSMPGAIRRRDSGLSRDIVIVWIGTNDLSLGTSTATIYGKITTIVGNLKTAGFEVWVCTIIDRQNYTNPSFNTDRAALNVLINANTAGADLILDLAADSRLSNASVGTYFDADLIHLNATGNGVVAALAEAQL